MKKRIKYSAIIALAPWREAEILSSIKETKYDHSKIEIIIEKGLNVPINRNNGIKKSKGEILIFLDDDGIIEKDFFKNVDSFTNEHPEIAIFGGPQLTPKDDSFFSKINRDVMAEELVCPGISKRYKKNPLSLNANSNFLSGALLICRKEVFKDLLFDPKQYPADEVSLIDKARRLGFKVGYTPEVFIYHRGRSNTKGYVKQIFFFGNSRSRKEKLNGFFKNPLFYFPAVFDIYLLFLIGLMIFSFMKNISLARYLVFFIPLFFYFVIFFIVALKISLKNKNAKSFFVSCYLIFLTHISYGAGIISGIVNKSQREGI